MRKLEEIGVAIIIIVGFAIFAMFLSNRLATPEAESKNNQEYIQLHKTCDSLKLEIAKNRDLIELNIKIDEYQDTSLHKIREILELMRKINELNR